MGNLAVLAQSAYLFSLHLCRASPVCPLGLKSQPRSSWCTVINPFI